jgi:hypothetical protein
MKAWVIDGRLETLEVREIERGVYADRPEGEEE